MNKLSRPTITLFAWSITMVLPCFCYAYNIDTRYYLPDTNSKYKHAKIVFEKLWKVIDEKKDSLTFLIEQKGIDNPNGSPVAYYYGDKHILAIEEETFESCKEMGEKVDAALALVIGHELAHHFGTDKQKKGYPCSFRTEYDMFPEKEIIASESNADLMGNYYAQLAGYHLEGVAEGLLPTLYKEFELPDKIDNYPSKGERIEMAKKAAFESRKLANLFHAASSLMVLQEYEKAILIYDELSKQFRSREMFFNAAIARLQVLNMLEKDTTSPLFPLCFDTETRAGKAIKYKNITHLNIEKLHQEIRDKLAKCRKLDGSYQLVLLYQAYYQSLLFRKNKEQKYLLSDAMNLLEKVNDKKLFSHKHLLSGYLYQLWEKEEEALAAYQKVTDSCLSKYVQINIDLLHKIKPVPVFPQEINHFEKKDTWEKIQGDLQGETLATHHITNPITNDVLVIEIFSNEKEQYSCTKIHYANQPNHFVKLFQVMPDYKHSTNQGIKIGNTFTQIQKEYGATPTQYTSAFQKDFVQYRLHDAIIFELNEQAEVKGWTIYELQ